MKLVQWIFIVFLGAKVLGFQCPRAVGNFAHRDKCNQYFTCLTFLPILRGCHQGQIFDKNLSKCVPAKGNGCWQATSKDGLMIGGFQAKQAPTLQPSCSSFGATEMVQPTVFTTIYTSTTNTIVRITEYETQTTTLRIAATTTTTVAFTTTVRP